MASIIELLRVFACQDEPVLISGPTGAGKTRLARWCHAQSEVAAGPFETLDLAAIPEDLQLAELFGWRKGAFTGAVRDNLGVIARARGGTLFIDEIDNLSPRAQAGLLHVLEERKYRTLGDEGGERIAEVRFIIGTNARLVDAVKERRFREDLYYRINVLPVKVPALRDRPEEIPLWATYMAMRHHAKRAPEGVIRLSKQAESVLLAHAWPGNLRELDNIIRRAYAIAMIAYGGASPRELAIDEEHVRHALAQDGIVERGSVIEAMMSAAQRFVAEAERHAAASINLEHADAFKGFVLAVAIRSLGGNRDAAFRLFGREKLVTSRNHQKVLKRELERVQGLCNALGRPDQFPFDDLANDEIRSVPPPRTAGETGDGA